MFADISHERQQSLLRQRNLFALTSAGLGIALVVAVSLATTRDREVVLLPTLPKQLTVSSAGVEADYLELVTRDAALVLLNRSPEGLDYWMDEILKLADPASYGRLKADLVRIVEEQRGSDVTQAFVIRSMTVDPKGLTSDPAPPHTTSPPPGGLPCLPDLWVPSLRWRPGPCPPWHPP